MDSLIFSSLLFIVSLYALMKGADWLVDSASSLAKKLGISDIAIGLTLVALGTSFPEFIVSIYSTLEGYSSLAFGNVIGSNIANILLVLGVSALIYPIVTPKDFALRDQIFFLITALAPGFFLLINFTFNKSDSSEKYYLGAIEGWVLLGILILFSYLIFLSMKKDSKTAEKTPGTKKEYITDGLFIVLGMVLLVLGGKYSVQSATDIAKLLNVSDSIIGLSIMAFGTSLPELVTSIVAAKKGKSSMAIGNIVGSNIINVSLVLGTSLALSPMILNKTDMINTIIMTVISLFFIMINLRKSTPQFTKLIGGLFLAAYVGFIGFLSLT